MTRTKTIKLFVFDFDGTALGGHIPYEQFPKPFARFLDKLTASGIHWATNTTWDVEKQFQVVKQSKVKTRLVFLTGQTSRQLATIRNGRLVHDEKYENKVLSRAKQFKRKNWPQMRRVLLKMLNEDLVERISYNSFNHGYLNFLCKKGAVEKVEKCIRPLIASGEFYRWNFNSGVADTLLPKYMNKGESMKVLQKRLRIGPENIIAAGDGINDRHMFDPEYARWIVCPANVHPHIKNLVKKAGGVVATKEFSWGVIEGVQKLLKQLEKDQK